MVPFKEVILLVVKYLFMISSNQKTLAALLDLTVWAIQTCYYGSCIEERVSKVETDIITSISIRLVYGV
jgi:hypothetical protein